MIELDDSSWWPRVTCGGVTYAVAPRYVHGVGIGEAATLAESQGCELPTPALVDAIWLAADCKVDGSTLTRQSDGTPKTMSSIDVLADQAARIARRIDAWKRVNGREPTLIAGTHKDVVRTESGHLGIYGWQKADGAPLQPVFTGHGSFWIDYSQGCRLVKRFA